MKSRSHAEIKQQVKQSKGLVVEDMIQDQSVNILVGDSGIGKSPLLMQLGLCVAAGIPFLGLATRPGPVLYVDGENSIIDLDEIVDNLLIYLKLTSAPDSFRFLHFPESITEMEREIVEMRPTFVIIDSLRSLDPNAEKDNISAGARLQSLVRAAEKYHCAFLFLHHIRKVDQKEPPKKISALDSPLMDWLQQASGARALVNQTEARFGVEEYSSNEAALMLRGYFKLRGEVGPWVLERVHNEYGDPLGYSRLSGEQLLTQTERERFRKLPAEFTWKQAQDIVSPGKRGGKALSNLLRHAAAASLLVHSGHKNESIYRKTSA